MIKAVLIDPASGEAISLVAAVQQTTAAVNDSTSAIQVLDNDFNTVIGTTADAPIDILEDTTPRTGITLWKGIKNYLQGLYSAVISPGSGLPVNAIVIGANKINSSTVVVPICDDVGKLYVNAGQVQIVDSNGAGIITDGNGNLIVVKAYNRETVVESTHATSSGDSGTLANDYGYYAEIIAQLNVTAHTGATGTLDVKFQHSVDGGTTWVDLASFAQVTTSNGAIYLTMSRWDFTGPVFFGNKLKVVWALAGVSPDFTFTVDAVFKS